MLCKSEQHQCGLQGRLLVPFCIYLRGNHLVLSFKLLTGRQVEVNNNQHEINRLDVAVPERANRLVVMTESVTCNEPLLDETDTKHFLDLQLQHQDRCFHRQCQRQTLPRQLANSHVNICWLRLLLPFPEACHQTLQPHLFQSASRLHHTARRIHKQPR